MRKKLDKSSRPNKKDLETDLIIDDLLPYEVLLYRRHLTA